MGSIAFAFNDAIHAVPILLVFFAVISRIAPAVIRIQQHVLVIKSNIGYSESTLEILDSMQTVSHNSRIERIASAKSHVSGSIGKISCEKMTFKYPGNLGATPTVNSFTFEFTKGRSYAITGPSGSGKSTLVNMIIGLIPPDSGEVSIFGVSPNKLIASHPGTIGVVPQQIFLIDGTLRENIVLDSSRFTVDDEEVIRILNLVKLDTWFESLEEGLETRISNLNSLLSGGQVQRLGIARSLITNPEILILDESTSALDQQTEFDINKMLFELSPRLTILAIAHRPTTLQLFEEIIYMEQGSLRMSGNFAQIAHLLKAV
jgi:ABC-type bacteriocin/lantibiotic exporter with double-glycine peptidase domain